MCEVTGILIWPRFVTRFIMRWTLLTVRDPAAGTGGSFAESFEHLQSQCKTADVLPTFSEDRSSRLSQNLVLPPLPNEAPLHGLEYPEIDSSNACRLTGGGDA